MQQVAELNNYTFNSTGNTITEGFIELGLYNDIGQPALIIQDNHHGPHSIPTVNLFDYGIIADDDHIILHDDGIHHNIWRDLNDLGIIENHVEPIIYGPFASRAVHAKLTPSVADLARDMIAETYPTDA